MTPPTEKQLRHFKEDNQPFQCAIPGPWMTHDEALEPFHQLVGWDARCGACRAAKAYTEAMPGMRHTEGVRA